MNVLNRDIQRGYGNNERPVVRVLWDRDSRTRTSPIDETGNYEPERRHVDYQRYYDRDYYAREIERVWKKSWLFAGREEDIPAIGDKMPFDCGTMSFIIVHSAENEFKAFYNSCLHRGTRLCDKHESSATIRCPYHGWEWKNDGTLKRIPSHWDFAELTRLNGSLPEARLERWGGFLFITVDKDAPPLAEALGVVPRHFADFDPANRYTAARFRKHVRANWKIAQEAFMESYHVVATHPEGIPYNGDSQTQYDIWQDAHGHIGRQITPSAVPSMHAAADATPLAAAQAYAMIMQSWHYPDAALPTIDPDGDVRAQVGEWHRQVFTQTYGRPQTAPDAVMIDSLLYFMLPHATFWLSESLPFTYQFTPHPTDPQQSFFEVRMLLPWREGTPRPASSPAILVAPEERIFDKAPAFGFLAHIFDQDMENMPLIQRGMHAAPDSRPYSTLGTYQEMIMQHWHDVLDRMMADEG